VEALHARIESLERQLLAYQQKAPADLPGEHGKETAPQSDPSVAPDTNLLAERGPVDDLAETVGQLDIAEDGHLRYFGAPSYFNLLRNNPYGTSTSPDGDEFDFDAALPHNVIDVDLSVELQSHLLDLYWKWQNPWQYVVHRTAFSRAMERGTYDEYCTPLLLRCVLALASRYCDHVEVRLDPIDANTAGDLLAAQANDYLSIELQHPSTSTAAALAILALREMSVNKESLGWIYIGNAVPKPSLEGFTRRLLILV
jgi:hypothetical protein